MNHKIFRECSVLSVYDDEAQLRIKVRFNPEDNHVDDENLPFCFPLMPKHFQIAPKVGEMVLVVTSVMDASDSRRWFIGPIISQQYMLDNEPFISASGEYLQPLPRPDLNPENEGSYPDREDIAVQGRQNADLILKRNEVRLRCGFKKEPYAIAKNQLLFNKEDLAYIQMKYKMLKDNNGNNFSSTINVVADRINLLSHDSRTPFKLNDKKELVTDEELLNILDKAHPLVYGDMLIDFLKNLMEMIKNHSHSFPQDPPNFDTTENDVLQTDFDKMISQSIRIN